MSANRSIVCIECGTENPGYYAFCFSCGSSLSVPERVSPEEMAESAPALLACPKCKTANPGDYQYCAQCGTRLRSRAEGRKTVGIPLVLGLIGGLVAAVYSHTHGALPIRVAFSAVFGFGFWWALAALVAWLLRPSWRRAAAVAAAALLIVIVGAVYAFTQAWLGQNLAYIELPTPTSTYVEVTATPEPKPVFTSTRPKWSPPGWPPSAATRRLWTPTPVSSACSPWQVAKTYVGRFKCICGDVRHIQNTGDTFFIHFAEGNEAFYGFSREYYWDQGMLEGRCVRICGTIETNYGRPRILIDDPDDQVFWCD